MSLDDALRAAPRLLRARADGLLPLYLLAASAPGVARTPLVAAVAVAVASLAATGRLDRLVAALREVDVGTGAGGDPFGPSGATGTAESEALAEAVAGLLTPTVVALLVVGGAATLVVLVLARAVGSAATLAAVDAGLRDDPPLVAGVRGIPRHWRPFAVLTLVRVGLYVALGGLFVAVVAVAGGVAAAAGTPAAAAVLAVLGGLAALPVVAAVELLFAFAGCAVVVDDAGAAVALRRAAGLGRERPGAYAVLLAAGGAAVVGVGVLTALATVGGVGRAVALLVTLVVLPLFDGLRVALYADRGAEVEGGTGGAFAVVRDGLAALGRFLREHPGANAGGAALLTLGATAGWALVAPYGVTLGGPSDVGQVFGAVAVGPFVNIAANNWLVAASAAYGGLAAGLPTVAALGLNGVLVGAVVAATDRLTFLALVGPHGVIELPAIAVAGGLGLHLGRVGLDAVRGRRSAAAVAETVRRAFRVLVGLAVVFVVAAAVEAFVTPAVAAAVLG